MLLLRTIRQYIFCPFSGSISFADFLDLMAQVMSQTTNWGVLKTKLDGYVGFDTIQEQNKRKSIRRGFEFNIIVVG